MSTNPSRSPSQQGPSTPPRHRSRSDTYALRSGSDWGPARPGGVSTFSCLTGPSGPLMIFMEVQEVHGGTVEEGGRGGEETKSEKIPLGELKISCLIEEGREEPEVGCAKWTSGSLNQ